MKMDDMPALAQQSAPQASPEVFHQLGLITRQLHDTLQQLGVMPNLQAAADGLPDARSRLSYIARKTGEAADKVLNSVDQAKLEHGRISEQTRRIAAAIVADPVRAVATGAVINFVGDVEAATARIDAHLTDIMMAQDFHDLTGQVVAKVVALARTSKTRWSSCWFRPRHRSKCTRSRLRCSTAPWSTPSNAPTWCTTRARSTTCWPAWGSDVALREPVAA